MANKKINQLVSKTSILSTDLFGIGDATTGQLFKKTIAELQAAIGGAVISVNGLVGTVVLDTDDIQELATPTNKYFTDARARGAISLTVTGNSGASTYSSGTGVLNVPTYTLAGLGGITASFLSGASGISYNSTTGVISYSGTVYTDSSIRALLSGGTGITYNSSTGAISYSGTVYTDSSVRALISITTTGDSGASTYNNTTGVINVPNYTLAGLGGISLTSLSGGTGITYNNTTGAISYSGTVYTDASVRALISASGSVSYNNTTGVISLTSGNLTEATSSVLTITGGTGAVLGSGTSIQVKQATTSVSGFLSSTDWNTFNNKQSALTNPVTGTGTTNYIAKFTSSTGIGNSQIFDDGTNVGIGVSTITGNANRILHVSGTDSAELHLTRSNSGTSSTLGGYVNFDGSNNFNLQNRSGNAINLIVGTTTALSIASTGAATFSSSVMVNGSTVSTEGLSVQYNQAKTYTTQTAVSRWHSNESAGSQFKLNLFAIGNATGSSRVFSFQTSNEGVANDGIISLQAGGGNVGIGIITPADKFQVNLASAKNVFARLGANNLPSIGFLNDAGGAYVAGEINSSALTITGNVGIGNTNPGSYSADANQLVVGTTSGSNGITIVGSTYSNIYFATGTAGSARFKGYIEYGHSSDYMVFATNVTERMRITSGGNILMGTTTDNGERLYVSGAIRATGTITANSDLTLKKNLLRIENALEKVEQINGYTYEFKADDSKRHAGVIAQEIQTVLPEIVNKGNDGILGVEYGNISALLIEATKEQQKQIKAQQTQINELKALLNK